MILLLSFSFKSSIDPAPLLSFKSTVDPAPLLYVYLPTCYRELRDRWISLRLGVHGVGFSSRWISLALGVHGVGFSSRCISPGLLSESLRHLGISAQYISQVLAKEPAQAWGVVDLRLVQLPPTSVHTARRVESRIGMVGLGSRV